MISPTSEHTPDELLNPDFHAYGHPHALWKKMRDQAPVFRHSHTDYSNVISVTRFADIRKIYQTPKYFSSEFGALLRKDIAQDDPGGGLALALTDPPKQREIRNVMSPFFSGTAVKDMTEFIGSRLYQMLMSASNTPSYVINISETICTRLTLENTALIIGLPEEDWPMHLVWLIEAFHKGESVLRNVECYQYLLELINERRLNPQSDLTTALVTAIGDGGRPMFNDLEILLNIENLLGATENAGITLAATLQAFSESPDQLELLQRNPEMLSKSIHEILRWTSSATHSMRTVVAPTELAGVQLHEGDRVALWLPSANRDEQIFPNPETFDLTKNTSNPLTLGAGVHACIGGMLSRIQLFELLTHLITGEFEIEPVGSITPIRSIAVNGPEVFPVTVRRSAHQTKKYF